MTTVLFTLGLVVATTLVVMLLATKAGGTFRIWPTPGPGSWQSYVWWPLFRGLNGLAFATALAASFERPPLFGLPLWLRLLVLALLVGSVALFVYAFRVLGRDNSYGATDGLVTGGIYQWSRNPQNAMLMVVYGCLAVAADSLPGVTVALGMVAVYFLMVLVEEPWLEGIYGEPYRRYCREVPRFFHWRRLFGGTSGSGNGA